MNKSAIIDTVRKMLRLAKQASNKNEAATAFKMAQDLMEKHNFNVSHDDTEDFRIIVPSVAGSFWREQLLNNIARSNECRLLRQDRGAGKYEAVLAGYASDVERSRDLYMRIQTQMVLDCCLRWKKFTADELYSVARGWDSDEYIIGRDGFDPVSGDVPRSFEQMRQNAKARVDKLDIVEKEITGKRAFAAWARAYLDTASDEFGKKLAEPRVKPAQPAYERAPFVPPRAPPEESNKDKEIAKIQEDAKALAKKFGEQLAQRLQRDAVNNGKSFGGRAAMILKVRNPKRLTAASSWLPPPPPPTRFSALDLDGAPERVVAKEEPAKRKVELDFDDKPQKQKTRKRSERELDLD